MNYVYRGGFMVPESACESGGCGCSECEARPIQSDNVAYSGPNLPCTGIRTCDNFTDAIKKIDLAICDLKTKLYNLTSTTTTILT